MIISHYIWWIGAVLLTVVELLTGTFYVLMAAVGFAAGGIVALVEPSFLVQTIVTVVVGTLATGLWHRRRIRSDVGRRDSQRNPDVVQDIGAVIEVTHWTDGKARVNYRGSQWDAVPEVPGTPAVGHLVVKEVRGSVLILGVQGVTHV